VKRLPLTLATVTFGLAALTADPGSAVAQINLNGVVRTQGVINFPSQSGVHQNTHIWAFNPPNGSGGAADNANFVNNVMSSSTIDGVSILEAWNQIETSPPDSTVCAPSDLCQPDPVLPLTYHHYVWTTYDSTAMGSPVKQWLDMHSRSKLVNLLIAGQASGTTNPITPHYVTSPAWYNLFSIQQQDVINALKDCTGVPWTGTSPSSGASYSPTPPTVTVTDTNCCSGASQGSTVQDQDLVWVTASPSGCGTTSAGATASVAMGSTTQFSYSPSGTCSSPTSVKYISAAQSWAVPYESPYKSALKAYWAAVVAHYGPSFSLGVTNYFSQLNYFRFGGSVGSEWFPYCVSNGAGVGLAYLTPMSYAFTSGVWLGYYQEMGNYLQSLGPPFKVIHSINVVETSPGTLDYTYPTAEAGYAVGWSNAFGARDGFGSQGLSAKDYVNCTTGPGCNTGAQYSASNWYPLFQTYGPRGVPIELQPIALSYEGDLDCITPVVCGVTTYSGDLPTFLYPFATDAGGTDFEIYWRDLSLAYDVNNYCALNAPPPPPPPVSCTFSTSVTTGTQISPASLQLTFFQDVGQGNNPTQCGSNTPQTHATGKCQYATNINSAHGQH
jgi:hypothetical protein